MGQKETVCQYLEDHGIPFELVEHPPVYTIEEMEQYSVTDQGDVVKNLFLRDYKGKKHFLVCLQKDKKADLKNIREQLGSTPLSFASEERLMKYLGLTKGAVTPFGILNDENREVTVVFDKDLTSSERLGVHPNDNTATVFLSFASLKKLIEEHGNPLIFADI